MFTFIKSYVDLKTIKAISIKKEYAISFSARSSDKIFNLDKPNNATVDANISIKLSRPKLNNVVEF